jgi:hypothetical protein
MDTDKEKPIDDPDREDQNAPRQELFPGKQKIRHTFASWLALQGETTLTIEELLGHKTLAMAERYSHLIPDHKRRVILAMEKGFSNPENCMIVSVEGEKNQRK